MTSFTVEALARLVAGHILGEAHRVIHGAQALEKAGPDDITFVLNERNLRRLKSSRAGAAIVERGQPIAADGLPAGICLILVADPLDAFLTVLGQFRPRRERPALGISPQASVSGTARIGAGTNVFPGAWIGDEAQVGARCDIHPGVVLSAGCRVGDDCVLHPHAVLYPDVRIGDRVIIHASAVIGADGFGYRFQNGRFEKVPQLGWVEVQDDVEIGACTTIDRGMIGPTTVGTGTKLDNLVMIGHNCEIGKHNAFASQAGLAGSVITGDYVRCAGQVGVAGHLLIGKGAVLGAKAGIHRDVPEGETHFGCPARPEAEQRRIMMSESKIPEMRKQMRRMEIEVAELRRMCAALESQREPIEHESDRPTIQRDAA